ncbi:hypothetical protein LWI29_028920 [Acer saccharum]|uniref:Uncharacterized protein n=1 Tax=Acer saccharum TaxID=4024 RepID=A0AA39W8X6_ACESA|nr:hypothetical protein LWI29_028920 [Acer saccharum]
MRLFFQVNIFPKPMTTQCLCGRMSQLLSMLWLMTILQAIMQAFLNSQNLVTVHFYSTNRSLDIPLIKIILGMILFYIRYLMLMEILLLLL